MIGAPYSGWAGSGVRVRQVGCIRCSALIPRSEPRCWACGSRPAPQQRSLSFVRWRFPGCAPTDRRRRRVPALSGSARCSARSWRGRSSTTGHARPRRRSPHSGNARPGLSARALAPGSPLACLDALAGESVEAACEKAMFASPAAVAAATSYVAARLALLSDMAPTPKTAAPISTGLLLPLRRALETDRFGFLAHVLAVRDGCTARIAGRLRCCTTRAACAPI